MGKGRFFGESHFETTLKGTWEIIVRKMNKKFRQTNSQEINKKEKRKKNRTLNGNFKHIEASENFFLRSG